VHAYVDPVYMGSGQLPIFARAGTAATSLPLAETVAVELGPAPAAGPEGWSGTAFTGAVFTAAVMTGSSDLEIFMGGPRRWGGN
jgi:hypothetical protein